MPLRTIIEQTTQYKTGLSTREKIEEGRKNLFDFPYPIFDENYRKVFETHFIRNFYMREIGFETEGLFKLRLENWLEINMPYFNKLFESETLTYDPLLNTKMDVTHNKKNDKNQLDNRDTITDTSNESNGKSDINGTSNADSTNTSNATSDSTGNTKSNGSSDTNQSHDNTTTGTRNNDDFNRQIKSDTPDSRLNLTTNDGQGILEYASEITENNINNKENTNETNKGTNDSNTTTTNNTDNTNHSESSITDKGTQDITSSTNQVTNQTDNGNRTTNDKMTSDINETEDYIEHRVGKTGTQTYPSMVQEYRASFLRIEKQIFEEMQQLFMLVY